MKKPALVRPIDQEGNPFNFNETHFHFRHPRFWQWFESVPKTAPLVEIGCGSGSNVKKLLRRGFKNISLLDIEDQRVYRETVREPHDPLRSIPFALIDANKDRLPYEDESVDCLIATEVIEHLENPWFFTREILRVLSPQGRLVLSMPLPWNVPSRFLFFLKGKLEHYGLTHPHHPWAPTKEIFQQTLRGFELVDAFYSERKKTHFFKHLHLTVKFHFPPTQTWCEYGCFLFTKNANAQAVPRL